MAGKDGNNKVGSYDSVGDKGGVGGKVNFADYVLDDAEKAVCKAWTPDGEEILAAINGWLLDAGTTLRLAEDTFNSCYMAQFYFRTGNGGSFCVVGRGSSPMKALKQLVYLYNKADGQWMFFFTEVGKKKRMDD